MVSDLFWPENGEGVDVNSFLSDFLKMGIAFTEKGMDSRDQGCFPFTQTNRMEILRHKYEMI